jgi:hypothetical protein
VGTPSLGDNFLTGTGTLLREGTVQWGGGGEGCHTPHTCMLCTHSTLCCVCTAPIVCALREQVSCVLDGTPSNDFEAWKHHSSGHFLLSAVHYAVCVRVRVRARALDLLTPWVCVRVGEGGGSQCACMCKSVSFRFPCQHCCL